MSNQKMKGITCCGECGNYSWKKHRCMIGATNEMNAANLFYDDCPLPDVSASAHKWIPCSERLPEESLNSVLGWDEYRERCVFVQYWRGLWRFPNLDYSVKILAWMPLPEPYREEKRDETR